jgi:subtilisin family serine protease
MTEKTTIESRRIGAKLRGVLEESYLDSVRRARYRPWIFCSREGADEDLGRGDPSVYVAVTIAFEPGSERPERELGKRLAASEASIRSRLGLLYVAPRYERGRVRILLHKHEIRDIAAAAGVRFVGVSDPIYAVGTVPLPAEPIVREPRAKPPPARVSIPKKFAAAIAGPKVVLGLIDVQGFDIAHPAFLGHDGNTLFARIWDQRSVLASQPGPPSEHSVAYPEWAQFVYGHDFSRKHLDAAIGLGGPVAYWTAGLPTTELGSHGTHVGSIAAGRFGVCPDAILAGVVFATGVRTDGNTIRDVNHGDGEKLRHAIIYLRTVARELALPLVINVSLGRHCGAHDGSSKLIREIDALTASEGCCVVVAAGNSGDSRLTSSAEGRVHAAGEVKASELTSLVWQVESNDSTDNEMEIWYGERDRLAVSVIAPGGEPHGPVAIDEETNHDFDVGSGARLRIVHKSYDPENGCNYIFIQLSPLADGQSVANGTWKVELSLAAGQDGPCRFNAWIERDDGSASASADRRFQSYFKVADFRRNDHTKVNSLACGHNMIAVANWDEEAETLNASSSQGPTRDGRHKPDIAAPGTKVWGAYGFPVQVGEGIELDDLPRDGLYVRMSGTSMAAPYVAGVAALMLSLNRDLTASQIRAIMISTVTPRAEWQKGSGYGVINVCACLEEAFRTRA